MCENNDILKICYENLRLDTRASKKEVELAYNVLSKNKDLTNDELKILRSSFEYIMGVKYGVGKKESEVENEEYENVYIQVSNLIPDNVQKALKYLENEYGDLGDKVKALFATQNVNFPLLVYSLHLNGKTILGKHIWTKEDIDKVLKECCVNDVSYSNILLEISTDFSVTYDSKYLFDLLDAIRQIELNDKNLCPKFELKKVKDGVIASIICCTDYSSKLEMFLKNKCESLGLRLNMVILDTNSDNIIE